MSKYDSHVEFRDYIVRELRLELFGPEPEDPDERKTEEITVSPLQRYSTGVLFPQKTVQEVLEDTGDEAAGEEGTEDAAADLDDVELNMTGQRRGSGNDDNDSSEREPLNLANEFSPSALGISFRLGQPTEIDVRVTFGTYEKTNVKEPNSRAGQKKFDGTTEPVFRELPGFKRIHHDIVKRLSIPAGPAVLSPLFVDDGGLQLHATVRRRSDGSLVVSLMAVNHKSGGGNAFPENEDAYFQVAFDVREENGTPVFQPIDRSVGNTSDEEQISMELLYRHRRAFALGHGCAGDWNRDEALSENGAIDVVRTASIPLYELKPIVPRESAFSSGDLNLSMRFLYEGSGGDSPEGDILGALRSLWEDYRSWIEKVQTDSRELEERLRDAADGHVEKCRKCLNRIEQGIAVLETNSDAMSAFRLMNKAMLMQQYHSSVLRPRSMEDDFPDIPEGYRDLSEDRKWRPFQLAFILMNVPCTTNASHDERRLVDLIWFPTGGGKTEAYLGLAAFTVLMGRITGEQLAGTTVLMRYTLRLLTAQQFQRAATLILALEVIRQEADLGIQLGEMPISIGLWVGQSLSPNRRAQARTALRELQTKTYAQNPFQVLECPWCRVSLTEKGHLGYVSERVGSGRERTVIFRCPDTNCRFGGGDRTLPILVVDDDIYERPPTLLIGTVDKFAQVAWEQNVGRLFGIGTENPPPALIIQDELHLIAGPLGTIVGLYETAIDRLCSRDGHSYKIVASTATIRRAREQCWGLYERETFEFPAQGIRAGDSYFAFEDTESPGRLYAGVFGSAVKSHQTALRNTATPLLQAVCDDPEGLNDNQRAIVDPYGTLVWYFNSLRELGHAATLCAGDIPEYLKTTCHRNRVSFDHRRYVREVVEMTSRRTADEIPTILQQLEQPWRQIPEGHYPIDVLLATNMIAVGVDVPRLGLFLISGQPKSTSEYIQASSRVGRRYPGLVVTVYTQTKSRDRSHYERFVAYHQSLYRFVEPTSVTPFSPQARERGMRGVMIALARLGGGVATPDDIERLNTVIDDELDFISDRIESIDPDEEDAASRELRNWLDEWREIAPPEYGRMGGAVSTTTLAYPYGSQPDPIYQREAWPVMTSMRSVDGTCRALVLNRYHTNEDEE